MKRRTTSQADVAARPDSRPSTTATGRLRPRRAAVRFRCGAVGAIGRRSRNRRRNGSHARWPRVPQPAQPTRVQGAVLAGDLGPKASGYRISNVCASPFVAEANSKAIV